VDLPGLWLTPYFENHSTENKKTLTFSRKGPGVKFCEDNFLGQYLITYYYRQNNKECGDIFSKDDRHWCMCLACLM
jgi:hypothetical protein